MNCIYLPEISFEQMRRMQNFAVSRLRQGRGKELVFLCQHPPTISLGKRCTESEYQTQSARWATTGMAIVQTDRGGKITYHGPGQLLVYPVIDLRARKLGVRSFVCRVLNDIARTLNVEGVRPELDRAGVWVQSVDGVERKISSVGLRICGSVTNHGFSVNLECDLEVFKDFEVCGMPELEVTSLAREKGLPGYPLEAFAWELAVKLRASFLP